MNNEQTTSETTKKVYDQFILSCGFVAASGICFVFEKYSYVFKFLTLVMFLDFLALFS